MENTVIRMIASLIQQVKHLEKSADSNNFLPRSREYLALIERDYLPCGSGFDRGTKIDVKKSTHDKIVFSTAYHHMDDAGYYDGWTEHTVTIRPSFVYGFEISVTGSNKNQIKETISDAFSYVLDVELTRQTLEERIGLLPVK